MHHVTRRRDGLRVSTREQGRSGLGIDAQRAAVARFAEAEGFEVVGEFTEIETGKGSDAFVLDADGFVDMLDDFGLKPSEQAGADRLCARDQRRPLRRPSGRGLNPASSAGTRFRRKAIRIEGDGEAK